MTTEDVGFPPDESGQRLAEALADVGRPLSLHAALRRVIVTNADPDTAAHRAVGVVAGWLRERAVKFGTEECYGEASTLSCAADELEAGASAPAVDTGEGE